MRLRWTLALAFVTLSGLQFAVVVPLALRDLSALLERQHEARVGQLMVAAEAERLRLEEQVSRTLRELGDSPALEAAARDAAQTPAPPTVTAAAAELMAPRGLDVLALLDDEGRTLSSGHVPARLGEGDDPLFAVTRTAPGATVTVTVEVAEPSGLTLAPALVSARAIEYGERRLWVVGGLRLDSTRAARLASLTGAAVSVRLEPTPAPALSADETLRHLDFGPRVHVDLRYSRAEVIATRTEVLRGFLALAALGLLFSLGAGFVISRRITRPVEALTTAARQIASGTPGVAVDLRATHGELRELVDAFNRMTGDLKRATDRLLASERIAAWQEVARRLAHEIKNPLTPIRMSLETLLAASARGFEDLRFQGLFRESAGAVLEEVDRLKRIVDEFTQFARLPRPSLQPLQVSELVTQVISLYSPHDGTTYAVDLDPSLSVRGDCDQLTQVLVNLLKNAEEAMQATKGGQVLVTTRAEGMEVVLEVRDEGPGIPAGLEQRLFEPYVTTKAGGTGLGLAIAARIAQEHEGRLEAANVPATQGLRSGASLRLVLPRASGKG